MGRRNVNDALRLPSPGIAARHRREQHPLMTEPQRKALITSAINVARIAVGGAIIGGCAVGLAAQADADSGSDCNPFYLSMTPQPVLACPGPDAAPPADGSPMLGPVNDVASPPTPGALPPPGQPPSAPPVVMDNSGGQ